MSIQETDSVERLTIGPETYLIKPDPPPLEPKRDFQRPISLSSEIQIIASTFLRITVQNLSPQIPLLISTFFIGHLPNAPVLIAGAGLAIAFTEVTGTAVAMGMSSAISTLVPQAIGAKKDRLIAIYFQRAFYVCMFTLIPVGILQWYGGDIMCAIGQPQETCAIISNYCKFLIIYIQFFCLISLLSRIGQALDFNTELFFCSAFCAVLSVPLNVLFVYTLDGGYLGTAVTVAICTILAALLIFCTLIYRGYSFIFKPLPFRVVFTWKGMVTEYLGLSIPVLFQIALPFWFYDLCLLLSGYVKDPDLTLSAGTIIGSILVCMSLIAEALYLTIAMRVGSYIGAGNVDNAKRSIGCAFIVYGVYALIIGVVLVLFQERIPYLYTNNDDTAKAVTDCMYIVVFRGIVYGIYVNVAAVYLGLGKPMYPACVMLFTQWMLSLSLMFCLLYELDFTKDTLYGMYVIWGTPAVVGYVVGAVVLSWCLAFRMDWKIALDESKARIARNLRVYGSMDFDESGAGSPKMMKYDTSVHFS
eukprot:180094_1